MQSFRDVLKISLIGWENLNRVYGEEKIYKKPIKKNVTCDKRALRKDAAYLHAKG